MTQHDRFIGGVGRRASGGAELDVIECFPARPLARSVRDGTFAGD
jgi:hypothetical protein